MSETFEVSRRTCFSQFFFSFTLVPYSFFLMNIWLLPALSPCELHNTSPWILFDKTAEYERVKNIFDHNRYSLFASLPLVSAVIRMHIKLYYEPLI